MCGSPDSGTLGWALFPRLFNAHLPAVALTRLERGAPPRGSYGVKMNLYLGAIMVHSDEFCPIVLDQQWESWQTGGRSLPAVDTIGSADWT